MSQSQGESKNRGGGGEMNGPAGHRRPPNRNRRPPVASSQNARVPILLASNNATSISSPTTINQRGGNATTQREPVAASTGGASANNNKSLKQPTSTPGPPPAKKSKKPPQQLKTISLGDLMQPNSFPSGTGKSRSRPQQQHQQKSVPLASPSPPALAVAQPLGVARDSEFPELSKAVAASIQQPQATITSTAPKAAWGGAKAPLQKAPTTPSTTEQLQQQPKGDQPKRQQRRGNQKRDTVKPTPLSPSKQPPAPPLPPKIKPTSPTKQASLSKGPLPPAKATMVLTADPNVLIRAGLDPTRKTNGQEFMKFAPTASTATITKGRQRVKPRKKKFTTLKKKVLQERLNKWRDMNPIPKPNAATRSDAESSKLGDKEDKPLQEPCTIGLFGFVHPDEDRVDDDDEYEELVSNLRDMAHKVGPTVDVFIPRRKEYYDETRYPVFVRFLESRDAAAAKSCWNGLVLGGQSLEVISLTTHPKGGDKVDREEEWHAAFVSKETADDCSFETANGAPRSVLVLENILSEDDLEDPDCLQETKNDAKSLVESFAKVIDVVVAEDNGSWLEVTLECNEVDAKAVASKLTEIVVGGTNLVARIKEPTDSQATTKIKSSPLLEIRNALSPEDFEDEDCLQESLDDIRTLTSQFGTVTNMQVLQENCIVTIAYEGEISVLENAARQLDGMMLGGSMISALVVADPNNAGIASAVVQPTSVILLESILTDDDMEDEECLEESLNDIKELATQFGKVVSVVMDQTQNAGNVRLTYDGGIDVANKAVSGFNGMLVGGQTVTASLLSASEDHPKTTDPTPSTTETGQGSQNVLPSDEGPSNVLETSKPDAANMFSGGKRIPDRFAECKRVPKIPNAGTPRHYARVSNDDTIKTLLLEMLEELTRLQRRAAEDKNAKARRRIVMGLREVARGIRAHKVKMVVMANNLDEYGAIDEKLQGILDLASAEEVPVFFELGKRALGKAVGKTIKVGVVGIQNSDGADQQFKKLNTLSRKLELSAAATSPVNAADPTGLIAETVST